VCISVLILTFNEAVNIRDCITSIPWQADINILDSGSSDTTMEVAMQLGAKTYVRDFTSYADQRNFGLSLPFRNDWIVVLDADERLTPELAIEIESAVNKGEPEVAMFCVRRKDIFMGRWLRRSSGYPTWFPRLFRRGRVKVSRIINEEYEASGKTGYLMEHILHYPFNKGMDWWFERHNLYSRLEANLIMESIGARPGLSQLLTFDPLRRRKALKHIAYSIPGRPWLIFIYLYLIKYGFLDGLPGYRYAMMRMAYEVMIDAKVAFLRKNLRLTKCSMV
jgi:glycosyltransferase involved in cell wall biosynthesis